MLYFVLQTEVEGQKVPTPVKAIKGVLDISMGATHTAVMVKPGQIYTFGRNLEGQLGAGNVKQISGYVEVKAMLDKTVIVSKGQSMNVTCEWRVPFAMLRSR
jgi:NIMA (never in mitosis gene a)-related kinase